MIAIAAAASGHRLHLSQRGASSQSVTPTVTNVTTTTASPITASPWYSRLTRARAARHTACRSAGSSIPGNVGRRSLRIALGSLAHSELASVAGPPLVEVTALWSCSTSYRSVPHSPVIRNERSQLWASICMERMNNAGSPFGTTLCAKTACSRWIRCAHSTTICTPSVLNTPSPSRRSSPDVQHGPRIPHSRCGATALAYPHGHQGTPPAAQCGCPRVHVASSTASLSAFLASRAARLHAYTACETTRGRAVTACCAPAHASIPQNTCDCH